jgi:hypothetical protein
MQIVYHRELCYVFDTFLRIAIEVSPVSVHIKLQWIKEIAVSSHWSWSLN